MSFDRAVGISGMAAVVVVLLALTPGSVASPHATDWSAHTDSTPLASAGLKIQYTIGLGKVPSGGAVDMRNGNVFVSNENSNSVTIVNATTHAHTSVSVGGAPDNLIYDPSNGNVYVPNENSSSVSILDGATGKLTTTVHLGTGAGPVLAFPDPANGNVLVFNNFSLTSSTNAWIIVNSTNVVKKLSLGLGVAGETAYSPVSKDLYVPNFANSSIKVISPSASVKSLALAGPPEMVSYDPASKLILYLLPPTASKPPAVGVITSSNAIGPPMPIPTYVGYYVGSPGVYDSFNRNVYYLSYNYSTSTPYIFAVTSPGMFAGATPLATGTTYFGLAIDPANRDIDVSAISSPSVEVLSNGTKVIKTLTTSQPILNFVYDPTTMQMFGAGDHNLTTKSVLYAIGAGNALSSITVGEDAVAFAYDPVDTFVYVANIGSDNLDIVS
jgi:YVTN family beta-propeller protein